MSDNTSGNTGMLAGIMSVGLGVGLAAYLVLAFGLKMPGFESAPAMIASWLVALLLCAVLSRGNRG